MRFMHPGLALFAIFAAMAAQASDAPSADWPQFRGPNRDGIVPGGPKLLDRWPKDGPPQLWKSDWIPACEEGGTSSPVVADGKVFVYANGKMPLAGGHAYKLITSELLASAVQEKVITPELSAKLEALKDTAIGSKREWEKELNKVKDPNVGKFMNYAWKRCYTLKDLIVCLDAATGKTLWSKEFPVDMDQLAKLGSVQWWTFTDGNVSATPAVWNGKVYAAGSMGLYCLSAKDGALCWQAKTDPEHCSPLAANGIIYHAGVAYNAESGAVAWKNPLWEGKHKRYETNARYMSPLFFTVGGKTCIVTSNCADDSRSAYVCLELETGKVLWSEKGDINAIPTIGGDILMMATNYAGSGARAVKVSPEGFQLLWRKPFSDGLGDIIWKNHVYLPGTVYKCVDLATGEFNWKKSFPHGAGEFSATVLADGKLITPMGQCHQLTKNYGDLTYSLSMCKASPEAYVEMGSFNPRICMMTSPAIAGGKLYLRLLDGVACYDLEEHGPYLDVVSVQKDAVTMRFKQTGGGLATKGASGGVQILDASGTHPASVRVNGDDITIDLTGLQGTFTVSYAEGAGLTAKNGQALPAFTWSEARVLKFRKAFENTIMLASELPLQQDGRWSKPETYAVEGAKVTRVVLDPEGRGVNLITDKAWKPGDAVAIGYAIFPVGQGEPRREKLAATAAELQRAAAVFVKTDEATSGNWQGVYGREGSFICRDKTGKPITFANVNVRNQEEAVPWANTQANTRNLQLAGDEKQRSITYWNAKEQMDIGIEFTDGKEHQVALYLPMGGAITMDIQDADTKTVLDTQKLADSKKNQYLIWNLKGQINLRVTTDIQDEGHSVWVGGFFIDPPGAAK